jgi:exosortase C (VPDSG-CTERM-specific)
MQGSRPEPALTCLNLNPDPFLPLNPQPSTLLPARLKWLWALTALLLASFAWPIWHWARFAWHSQLYSYILLIPFISAYFVRSIATADAGSLKLPTPDPESQAWRANLAVALWPLIGAVGLLAWYYATSGQGWVRQDFLAVMSSALVLLLLSAVCACLGIPAAGRLAFPLGFLFFAVPLPVALENGLESFLQHRSADVAQAFFGLFGMPLLRHDTIFQLPGFRLEVAPECSGIHSTVVLFITSVVAGQVFLKRGWTRLFLAAAVIPLALLRNGFRVFVIGELCVNVSPDMINSYIHRKGGPIFFALSLLPFFALLLGLRRLESPAANRETCAAEPKLTGFTR